MSVPYVIDSVTKIQYELTSNLGEGATAKIWKGKDKQEKLVAVKIANRGTSASLLEEFWTELSLLNILSQTEAGRNVPWAHKGEAPADPKAAIIVMELIPDEWQVTRLAQQAGDKLAADLALPSALQYAQLLTALHAAGYTTRGDRKARDLRWNPDEQQLVVLDWNRAKKIPSSRSQALMREELIRQDVRGFGQLWSELVFKAAAALPAVDDETDGDWQALARGFRSILARSLGSRTAWGYQTAEEIVQDIRTYQEYVRLAAAGARQVLATAESVSNQAMRTKDRGERSRLADQVLTLLDLARRQDPDGALDQAQVQSLKAWADEHTSLLIQQATEAAERINQALNLMDYAKAKERAMEAIHQLPRQGIEAHRAALRLARWLIAAQVGMDGNQIRVVMTAAVKSLQQCVLSMEKLSLRPAQAALEEAERDAPDQINNRLRPLHLEIGIRTGVGAAAKAESEGREGNARRLYDQALLDWEALEQSDPSYAEDLRADLDILDRKLSYQTVRADLEDASAQARSHLAADVENLLDALSSGESGWTAWKDLSNKLKTAREHYQDLRSLPVDLTDSDRLTHQFITWVGDVDDCMARGDVATALARVRQQSESAIVEEYRTKVLSRCTNAAIYEVGQLMKQDWQWPDDLQRAKEIIAWLRDPDLPLLKADLTEIEKIEELHEKSEEVLDDCRTNLNLFDGNRFTNDFASILSDPSDEKTDAELKKAADSRIEVFDRVGLSDEDVALRRVQTLLSKRSYARLITLSQSLASRAGALAAQLDDLVKSLSDGSQDMGKVLGLVKQASTTLEDASAKLGTKDIGTWREQMTAEIDSLQGLNESIEKAAGQWLDNKERVTKLTRDAEDWKQKLGTMDQAASEVREHKIRFDGAAAGLAEAIAGAPLELEKAKNAYRAVFYTLVAAGLQAVRELRLESAGGSDGAQEWLKRVRGWADAFKDDRLVQDGFHLLRQSVEWLEKVVKAGALDALKEWREAVLGRNRDKADETWLKLHSATQAAAICSGWVIDELRSQYSALSPRQGQVPIPEPRPQPPNPQPEPTVAEIDRLFHELEAIEDHPNRLPEVDEKLGTLKKLRSLNMEEQEKLKDKASWYAERNTLFHKIKEIEKDWDNALEAARVSHDQLHTNLEETNTCVMGTPADLPKAYWEGITSRLENAYAKSEILRDLDLSEVAWLGILKFRVQSWDWGGKIHKGERESLMWAIATRLADQPDRAALTAEDSVFRSNVAQLANDRDLDPKQAWSQIKELIEVKCQFGNLGKIETGNDLLEWSELAETTAKIEGMSHLSKEEQVGLQKRQRLVEVVKQWEQLAQPEKLQDLIEQTNPLAMAQPVELPGIYWQKLAESLDRAYNNPAISQPEREPRLFAWLGLLCSRIQHYAEAASKPPASPSSD